MSVGGGKGVCSSFPVVCVHVAEINHSCLSRQLRRISHTAADGDLSLQGKTKPVSIVVSKYHVRLYCHRRVV